MKIKPNNVLYATVSLALWFSLCFAILWELGA